MIHGEKVIIRLFDGETALGFTGQRDATLNMEKAELESTTKDSEGKKEIVNKITGKGRTGDAYVTSISIEYPYADVAFIRFFCRKRSTGRHRSSNIDH